MGADGDDGGFTGGFSGRTFAAGTGATGAYTVTLGTNHLFAGVFNGGLSDSTSTGLVITNAAGLTNITMTISNGVQGFYTASGGNTYIYVPMGGVGGVETESSGSLYLYASNFYTGGTLLAAAGGCNFNNDHSFGTGRITWYVGTNILATPAATAPLTITNAVTTTNGTQIFAGVAAAPLTFSGAWTLLGAGTINDFQNKNAGTTVTISGAISGAGVFQKSGAGTVILSGANAYTGMTLVTNGLLQLGSNTGLPSGTGKDILVVTNSAIFDLNGYSGSVDGLAGSGIVTNSVGTGTLTIGVANTNSAFTGPIKNGANPLNLTKTGTGTFTMSGVNTYTGVTTVNGGVLKLGVANAIPANSAAAITSGILDMSGLADTVPSLSGSGTISNNTSTLTVNGNRSTTSASAYSAFSGKVLGAGSIIKNGTHAMALRQTNLYGVNFSFNNGTLSVGARPDCYPTNAALALASAEVFQLDANNQTLSSLTGSGKVNLGGGTLTVKQLSGGNYAGVIQDSDLAGSSTALGHGLRGYYYDNPDFSVLTAVRDDATINFADLTVTNNNPLYPNTNQFSVRWLGQVLSTAAGSYTFTTTADDGVRLWVNGSLLVDNWVTQNTAATNSGAITLAANSRYDIVMEYFNNTNSSSAKLAWTPPGDSVSTIIPTDYLFLPGPGNLVMNGVNWTLTNANTFSGGTTIASGTLEAQKDGALGKGNVTLSDGATLHLDSPDATSTNGYISTSADLITSGATSQLNLDYFGNMTVHGFSTNGGASYLPPGLYGSIGSGQQFEVSQIVAGGVGYLNVTGVASTNALTSSAASINYGSSVTLTSTITGSGATPTGTVTFYDGANALGTTALDGTGTATLTVSDFQAITSHSITAVYSGDATYVRSTSSALTETIAPLTVSPGALSVSNKVYDATTNASIKPTYTTAITGVLAGDVNYVHLTGAVASFADKTIGTAKTVTITGLTLAGSLAGNYSLSSSTATASANITAKALTVTGIIASNRVYNATTNADINTSAAVLTGVIAGDTATLDLTSGVGSFATAAVANNKIVTIRGLTLLGADAGNYTVTSPTTTNNITQASTANSLISSANPSTINASITFTATPAPIAPGAGVPTGNIIFLTNSIAFSTNALAAGSATSTATAVLPLGTNTITAQYVGDANFIGSTNTLSQIVNAIVLVPTNIFITLSGSNAVLTWGGGGSLQSSTDITTNWANVPSATSPYTNIATNAQQFFRLKN